MKDFSNLNRRRWMQLSAGALSLAAMGGVQNLLAAEQGRRLRVAAIVTEFSYRSHAHVILENFLEPYLFNGRKTESGMDVVSLYVDQFPEGRDMSRGIAKDYGIEIFPTIEGALMRGKSELAVDAVLSIGEHGTYPLSDRGAQMYPRKRFFDEIAATFRKTGRSVPLFNDKHLSYRWDWSVEMMQVAQELKIPFMAGSSVPLAERQPPLELPDQAIIEEAVSVHGGGIESYDFHALEVLQSMVESRRGGETGVAEIQLIEGDAVWKAAEEGRWSYRLGLAALQAAEGKSISSLKDFVEPADGKPHAVHAILIKYCDGLRATILRIGASGTRWAFACRLKDQSEHATRFYVGPWQNRNLFKALSHAIQDHFRKGKAPYPVERTHLVTGMVAAAMDSHYEKNKLLETPHLHVAYQPIDFRAMREMGTTWKIITDDVPQPDGIERGGTKIK